MGALKIQRRGRDLNPRNLAVYRFSRPAVSTTHTPLQFYFYRVAGASSLSYYTKLSPSLKREKPPFLGAFCVDKSITCVATSKNYLQMRQCCCSGTPGLAPFLQNTAHTLVYRGSLLLKNPWTGCARPRPGPLSA